jgi:hypothetical protein
MNPAIPPVGGARDFHPKNVTYDIQKMRHHTISKVIFTAPKMEERKEVQHITQAATKKQCNIFSLFEIQ